MIAWLTLLGSSAHGSDLPEEQACHDGVGAACTVLAKAYDDGAGVPKDPFKAAQLYRQGCDLGHAPACMFLAEVNRTGTAGKVDPLRSLDLYMAACDLKNGLACRSVGDLYTMGVTGLADGKSAGMWYLRGCELGDGQSCTAAALFVERGDDPERSLALFDHACELGHHRGCALLAIRHQLGSDGAKRDVTLAYTYWQKGCSAPGFDPESCRTIGVAQLRGKLLPLDVEAGRQNLDRACYLGETLSCRYLAISHSKGGDPSEALMAAEQGCGIGDAPSCRLADRVRATLASGL